MSSAATVELDGRLLKLSNLDKQLFPDGSTKGDLVHYYATIAPVMLPHLAGRPVTRVRVPNGVGTQSFFEKAVPQGAPDWVQRIRVATPGSTRGRTELEYVLVPDRATLVWLANLAAIELHTPMWRDSTPHRPDLLVVDLDPGPGVDIVGCCRVAELVAEALAGVGMTLLPKTSGSKGLQLYGRPPAGLDDEGTTQLARSLAVGMRDAHPDLIVSEQTKALRPGKVLLDWSQNNPAKTTVTPYSVRAREAMTVSTPVTWDEVRGCTDARELRFTANDVLERAERLGDLYADLA